ncbi:squalene/phytoene synthase family protein, partial [Klebsiella pneumoniae]
ADDEIGDRPVRAAALEAWRADIESLYAGGDAGQAALVAEAVRRFALDKADFLAVIDGMAMDVAEDIRWPSMATLDLYCDRVASAVGRLSVKI